MLHRLYSKWVKVKLFNKILILYTFFTITVLLVCSVILANNFGNILVQNEKRYVNLAIGNIEQYLDNKKSTFSNLLVQIYIDSATKPEITSFLEGLISIPDFSDQSPTISVNDEIRTNSLFSNYIKSCLSRDGDIEDIIFYTIYNEKVWVFTRGMSRPFDKNTADMTQDEDLIGTKENRVLITPAQYCFYNSEYTNRRVFRISTNLKRKNTTTDIGIMQVGFKTDSLNAKIDQFTKPLMGNFLILTSDGGVVYDSSGNNYGRRYDYYDTVSNADLSIIKEDTPTVRIKDEDYYLFTSTNNDFGLKVVGLFPRKEILRHSESIKITVTTIIAICILLLFFMINLSTYFFSKRVRVVTSAMKKAREGDLSVRIPTNQEQDDLGEISAGFNTMCDSLTNYIERVYLYEIKQRNAEYRMLQSQINPHFLYNTLGAIQMKSLSEGGSETAQMIYSLADILRMAVKKENSIKIVDEVFYCEKYMELFKLRYGEKLSYKFLIDNNILNYGIPRHLLQPILENFLIHGIDSSRETNLVEISGYCSEKDIIFKITDNGVGIDSNRLSLIREALDGKEAYQGSGIGISNVNDRIKIIFGQDYGVEIMSETGKGTTVLMKLQALSVEEVNRRVQGINS